MGQFLWFKDPGELNRIEGPPTSAQHPDAPQTVGGASQFILPFFFFITRIKKQKIISNVLLPINIALLLS